MLVTISLSGFCQSGSESYHADLLVNSFNGLPSHQQRKDESDGSGMGNRPNSHHKVEGGLGFEGGKRDRGAVIHI